MQSFVLDSCMLQYVGIACFLQTRDLVTAVVWTELALSEVDYGFSPAATSEAVCVCCVLCCGTLDVVHVP